MLALSAGRILQQTALDYSKHFEAHCELLKCQLDTSDKVLSIKKTKKTRTIADKTLQYTAPEMIIQSRNVKALLDELLNPVSIEPISFKTRPLQSSVLLASTNGSMLSFSNSESSDGDSYSVNNLKMMSLLIRDKWSEDQTKPVDFPATNRYKQELTLPDNTTLSTNIFTYEIEDLHACVAQIPQSDLLLLFIADASYPYGLLALKMKKSLFAFQDMYGYKLG